MNARAATLPSMKIHNVVFDAGGVLLEWNPPAVVARLYPDPAIQAQIRQYIFEHPDWHEFDRGTLTEESAPAHFAKLSGRTHEEVRTLLRATAESLRPIDGTIRLLEDLAAICTPVRGAASSIFAPRYMRYSAPTTRMAVIAPLNLASSAARPRATALKQTRCPERMPAVPASAPRLPWRAACDITNRTAGPGESATRVQAAR